MRMHDALGDRPQEARAVGQSHRRIAFGHHRKRRRQRGHRLGDRRVHAAVDQPGGLLDLVAHATCADTSPVGVSEHLAGRRAGRTRGRRRSAARCSARPSRRHDSLRILLHAARRAPGWARQPTPMSRLDDLPPDQRATLSLLLRSGKSYAEVAALLDIQERAVHDRAHAALAVLAPRQARELTAERREEIGDYLLGQRPASPSACHAHLSRELRARTRLGGRARRRAGPARRRAAGDPRWRRAAAAAPARTRTTPRRAILQAPTAARRPPALRPQLARRRRAAARGDRRRRGRRRRADRRQRRRLGQQAASASSGTSARRARPAPTGAGSTNAAARRPKKTSGSP